MLQAIVTLGIGAIYAIAEFGFTPDVFGTTTTAMNYLRPAYLLLLLTVLLDAVWQYRSKS
jgi:hypothetical protein